MSEGIETIGSGVSDAMLARAIEPAHGEAGRSPAPQRCLNCGATLTGDYCHCCGQKAHLHRTISDFWHDLLHGVLHFDNKLWRTLPLLAWHPGDLTRRYIHGERARFISPFALFLFAVFLTFAAFHNIGSGFLGEENGTAQQGREGASDEIAKLNAEIKSLDEKIAKAKAAGQPTQQLEQDRDDAQTALNVIDTVQAFGVDTAIRSKQSSLSPIQIDFGDEIAAKPAVSKNDASKDANKDSTRVQNAPVRNDSVISSKLINHWIAKIKKNPELLAYKVQGYAYKYAWALIPLSALWLWLLYALDRRFLYYDHIVFVTYSIAFMMLLGTSLLALTALGMSAGWAIALFSLIAPVHMYRQIKGAYRGGTITTLVRTTLLMFGALSILPIFATILFFLGLT